MFGNSDMARLQGVQQQMGQHPHQRISQGQTMQAASQPPSFQAQQGSQQLAPSHVPPNFQNMGNMQQMRMRNQMTAPFTMNQNPTGMLALAQQGAVNIGATRGVQQRQQLGIGNPAGPSLSGQGNIFVSPSPSDVHASPSSGPLQPPVTSVDERQSLANSLELKQRERHVQIAIARAENERQQIVNAQTSLSEADFQSQLSAKDHEIISKREVLQKLNTLMSQYQLQYQGQHNRTPSNDHL
jgi:hypothetical protein